jgi:hypothetical protein
VLRGVFIAFGEPKAHDDRLVSLRRLANRPCREVLWLPTLGRSSVCGAPRLGGNYGRQGSSEGTPSGGRLQSKGSTSLLKLGPAECTVKDDSATNRPADASATKASIRVYSMRYLRINVQASYRRFRRGF